MKRSFKLIALACCILWSVRAGAQGFAGSDSTTKQQKPVFHRAIGVNLGSQGLGLEVQHPLPFHMNLRLGASILPDVKTSGVYTLSSFNTRVDAGSSSFWNAHMLMDVQPFYNAKNFFRKVVLSTGAAYFPKAKASALVQFDQNYQYGDMTFSPEEVGQLNTVSSWAGFAAYGGVGINNLVSANRFNLGLNLGTYYTEAPEVRITGTNMLEGNSANSKQLQKNMSEYRWLPVLQFNFNYSL